MRSVFFDASIVERVERAHRNCSARRTPCLRERGVGRAGKHWRGHEVLRHQLRLQDLNSTHGGRED